MRERVTNIISDEEIERVHGNANFGSMSKRQVVGEGVLKYAFGYDTGHTQLAILLEHGLVKKPKSMSYKTDVTEKGKRYLRALFNIFDILDLVYKRGR
jgi:predicted transcriptional regulator